MMDKRMLFASMLADNTFVGMNDCYKYGMSYGCDIHCPVLARHECELKDDENKEIYEECLKEYDIEKPDK